MTTDIRCIDCHHCPPRHGICRATRTTRKAGGRHLRNCEHFTDGRLSRALAELEQAGLTRVIRMLSFTADGRPQGFVDPAMSLADARKAQDIVCRVAGVELAAPTKQKPDPPPPPPPLRAA